MRMVDPGFDAANNKHSPLGSLILEAYVAARSYEHEVTVAGHPIVLSTFQLEAWNAIDAHDRLGISAPTSAGKSFVLCHKAVDMLSFGDGTIVYIVPTVSLIQQVTKDLRAAALRFGVSDISVYQTVTAGEVNLRGKNCYVLTQERALAALSQPETLRSVKLLIVDEVQNIERVANDDEERSRTLYEVIQEFEADRAIEKTVISGPRIANVAQLTKALYGESAHAITQSLPPVVNITYSFTHKANSVFIKQYSAGSDAPLQLEVSLPPKVKSALFGKQRYTPPVYDFIAELINKDDADHGILIFSPTPDKAVDIAVQSAARLPAAEGSELVSSLINYVSETVHPNYELTECLGKRVAFHHGRMPQHVRFAVEEAFSLLQIHALACTTTHELRGAA